MILQGKSYVCPNNHNFDMSSAGYINLLAGKKSAKDAGDNRNMVRARREFLSCGYYNPLRDKLKAIAKSLIDDIQNTNTIDILDMGCGEGYYTSLFSNISLPHRVVDSISVYGADVSKEAVNLGAKTYRSINFAVASVFDLPFNRKSFHILTSIFAPYSKDEISRVTKDDGFLISVTPAGDHLMEMKELLYENPYQNDEATYCLNADFIQVKKEKISYKILLPSSQHISNLFSMTPYYWKTSKSDTEKLCAMDSLETTAAFIITVYKKI